MTVTPRIVDHWAPEQATLKWRRPMPDGAARSHLKTYGEHLGRVGIADPTKASEFHARSISLEAAARRVTAESLSDTLASDLASGKADPSAISGAIAAQPSKSERTERAWRERMTLRTAARASERAGILAIHDYGEDAWLARLRPLASRALASLDQEDWDAVHAFAAFLRGPNVAGLATLTASNGSTVSSDCYRFARPDLAHLWKIKRAERTRDVLRPVNLGHVVFLYQWVTQGPRPSVREFDPTWGPGLYRASEALAHSAAILDRQQAEIDQATPAAQPRQRAVFI